MALGEAFVVMLLWSSTFIFVKLGLSYLSPLALAGFRYFLGFVVLLPLLLGRHHGWPANLSRRRWLYLSVMGILAYPLGNGLLFWSLQALPATTASFLLSTIPLMTVGLGILLLGERPRRGQLGGLALALAGGGLFFAGPLEATDWLAAGATLLGAVGLTLFGIMGRYFARDGVVDTLTLTTVPLAAGGGLLLILSWPGGAPRWTPVSVGIVLWLGLANTALAYFLWNHALKRLKAFEINVVANLMPMGTALIAWAMLGERLTLLQLVGMGIAIMGVIIVGQK